MTLENILDEVFVRRFLLEENNIAIKDLVEVLKAFTKSIAKRLQFANCIKVLQLSLYQEEKLSVAYETCCQYHSTRCYATRSKKMFQIYQKKAFALKYFGFIGT